MSDFVRFVFSYLDSAVVLAALAAAVGAVGLLAVFLVFRKKHGTARKFPWTKALLLLALVGYLAAVGCVTLLRSGFGGYHNASFHLFRAWREAWNDFSAKSWLNVLLNIAMFAPLGMLLPLLHRRFQRWQWTLCAGFLASLTIEAVQYILGSGVCDVDDLFCNILGTMLGFWLMMAVLSAVQRTPKRALAHSAALLTALAAIGSIFITYELREYGNLPDAPAYRVDTSDVVWTVSCALDADAQTVPVYHMDVPSKDDCAAFGLAFLQNCGAAEADAFPYNEEVYLYERNGSRRMRVWYLDGSYEYWDFDGFDIASPRYDQADETVIRQQLQKFGIEVPASAQFSYEDGWHRFTVPQMLEGETLTDGTLSCTYEDGFGIRELKNKLSEFTCYADTAIISPREAVEQVQAGWISAGDWFEYVNAKAIEITSCTLSYRVDTKGFYRPVYQIDLLCTDTGDAKTLVLPAMQ